VTAQLNSARRNDSGYGRQQGSSAIHVIGNPHAETPNTASYIQMSDQLGTLAPGKLADLILLDGDPLKGYGIGSKPKW
jgi:predicted amidohydrolase YtcJ